MGVDNNIDSPFINFEGSGVLASIFIYPSTLTGHGSEEITLMPEITYTAAGYSTLKDNGRMAIFKPGADNMRYRMYYSGYAGTDYMDVDYERVSATE